MAIIQLGKKENKKDKLEEKEARALMILFYNKLIAIFSKANLKWANSVTDEEAEKIKKIDVNRKLLTKNDMEDEGTVLEVMTDMTNNVDKMVREMIFNNKAKQNLFVKIRDSEDKEYAIGVIETLTLNSIKSLSVEDNITISDTFESAPDYIKIFKDLFIQAVDEFKGLTGEELMTKLENFNKNIDEEINKIETVH